MAEVGTLTIRQKLETKEFKDSLRESKTSVDNFAKGVKKVLGAIGIGVIGKEIFNLGMQASRTGAILEQAFKNATISDSQIRNIREFRDMADRNFGINKNEITEGLARLLQLTGSGGAVDRLKQSLIDMTQATGNTFENVSGIIGRTMQIGLTALTRYGIVATEEQKQQWDELGDDMIAKADFLNTMLQERYGGAAEAFANSAAGQFAKAREQLKTLGAELGTTLLPLLTKFLTMITNISKIFGGIPGLIAAIVAAILVYKAVSLATMSAEELKTVGLIGRYIALGMAKLWSTSPLLAITAGAGMLAGIGALIYAGLNMFGGSSIGGGGSIPSNTPVDKGEDGTIKVEVKTILEQNEMSEWVQKQVKRNGVDDNVNYNR